MINLAQRAALYYRHRFAPRALILMYHRVVDLPSDPQLLTVRRQHFEEQIEILRRSTRPMSLQELITALEQDKFPRRAVVITFDDGYADNLYNAKPILEHYGVPATVFVTAGYLGCQQEFWWDELERLLLQPGTLPETLSISINDSRIDWKAEGSAVYREEDVQPYQAWHIEQTVDPTPRHALYRSIYFLLHAASPAERSKVLHELRTWAGAGTAGRQTQRTLSIEEAIQLSRDGLIEIGAHTITHSPLAGLSYMAQRSEIIGSKICLEEILNRPVTSFAYPHGSYTRDTVAILQHSNFACACSSNTGAVWHSADPFLLPRIGVRDWDGDQFAGLLKGWLGY